MENRQVSTIQNVISFNAQLLDAGKPVETLVPHPKLAAAAWLTIAFTFSALLVYASIKYGIPNTDVMG